MSMELTEIKSKIKSLSCCVIIPTYNNSNTLQRVIDGVLEFTNDIIVVNDGSTDKTRRILENYPQIDRLHQPKNIGKGFALKTGFDHAVKKGFEFAITLDSDGQHFPKDIPLFIERLDQESTKRVLIIGDRNMNEADVLAKSARGNRASTYWMKVATGLVLQDSQSGFRLYPIKELSKLRFFKATKKFEFEIEVIVKAYWAGIFIDHIPINISYDLKERVSHFRPFLDITRMVVLYTWFIIVRIFYIIPRDYFRKIKKKGFRRFFFEDFLHNQDSPKKKALSIGLGIFLGLSPLWGFHTVIVIFLAILFKLNKVIAFAFSNISLPPFIPLVLLLSLQTGNWMLGFDISYNLEDMVTDFDIYQHLKAYLVGSITLSIMGSLIFGMLGYLLFLMVERKKVLLHD